MWKKILDNAWISVNDDARNMSDIQEGDFVKFTNGKVSEVTNVDLSEGYALTFDGGITIKYHKNGCFDYCHHCGPLENFDGFQIAAYGRK